MPEAHAEEWVNVSDHAVTLASGQPLAPGDHAVVDFDDAHNRSLRDDGLLIPHDQGSYGDLPPEQLQALIDQRGLTVEGTGKDGNVLKRDQVAALEAHDKEKN